MNELQLHERLQDAWGASSRNANRFEDAIKSIKWDYQYNADGETYYQVGGYTLTVENINPFQEAWRPCSHFSDGTVIEFK